MKIRFRWFAAAALATVSFGLGDPPEARANGRFPGADQLVLRGQNALVSSSFGILTTSDGFATTRWTCERALGFDPLQPNELGIAIFEGGALAVSGPTGLVVSTDGACNATHVGGPLADKWISDVSLDRAQATHGLAIARGPQVAGTSECATELFETKDNGATWTKVPSTFPERFCALTVDSAPSNPERVYLSGNVLAADGRKLSATLLVSDDRGATWTTREVPNEALPFIGAIDPTDAETLYIRTSNPPGTGHLLVSTDAGRTYRQIASMTGRTLQYFGVTGIAVSPDGSKVAYGSINEGLFVLERGKTEPEKRGDLPVMCLTWTDDALYACSASILCGPFVIGKSTDEGRTFASVVDSVNEIGETTTCPGGSATADTCPNEWPAVKARLTPCPGDAGTSDAAVDAGRVAPPPPKLSCDCSLGPFGGAPGVLGAFGPLLVVAAWLRRLARRR